jgi:hypothetical protein
MDFKFKDDSRKRNATYLTLDSLSGFGSLGGFSFGGFGSFGVLGLAGVACTFYLAFGYALFYFTSYFAISGNVDLF